MISDRLQFFACLESVLSYPLNLQGASTIPPPDYIARLSEPSSVTSARLPKTCQVPDAGSVHPSDASVLCPIVKKRQKGA